MTANDGTGGARLVTRRRLVVGGAAGAGVLVAAGYGRYAVGDELEEHLAGVLGIPAGSAGHLLSRARGRLGEVDYRIHAAAFVAATTAPGETALPDGMRRRAVERFVGNLVADQQDALVALGLQAPGLGSCRGLLRQ